ncbi:type IV pilus modification protein PilV [Modicisalibacter tunisiensis]|uniref:Type IV pilus modification protein PilV n=1 Tax=Modicisalibacter tunisiensis TaxID=390637 RepID=A0ABS7WWG6_9GAMM|nr:type IV pilus modification protein PilV [Modicisalibacter tunisiensis]MBZ9566588.1 type IV pilus modification protein PilV [Modicisalibacter tunisiensis]
MTGFQGAIAQKAGRHVRGFSLIEALVALLILAIGLLGVAGMQLKALQSTHMGYQRTIATLAAQDLQERLWRGLADDSACPDPSSTDWKAQMKDKWAPEWGQWLPGIGENPVSLGGGNCVYDISVSWDEGRATPDESNRQAFDYTVRLPNLGEGA